MSSGQTKGEGLSAEPTLWSSEAWAAAPDATLLALTRDGSAEAFGELWRRHLPAAYAVANRHRGRSAPEDIVAEAAARVLALLREGRGPEESFRAYFLTAVRTVAVDQGRRDLRLVPTEDDDLEELAAPALADPFAGLAVDEDGMALVRAAFGELSERDQRILWHTTVEGAAPRAVAPVLGMTANAVSVRAMRARESLRANFLDARAARGLAAADSDECRWTVEHLGAFVRGRLPKRQTERARAHVEGCPHAAALAEDLRVIHDGFPALVVPVVLAAGLMSPGFVTGGGLAAFSTALSTATTAASGTAASGTGAAAPTGQAGAPGLEGAAGHVSAADGGVTGASAAQASASGAGRAVDLVAQLAARATNVAAALAVTAGLAAALATPGPALADATLPAPRASTPTTAPAPRSVPTPAAPAGAAPSTSRPSSTTASLSALPATTAPGDLSAAAGGRRPSAGAARSDSDAVAASGSPRPTAATAPPAPVAQAPAASRPPAPAPPTPRTSTPTPTTTPDTPSGPPAPQDPAPSDPPSDGPAAPVVSVNLVKDGETARISVRVRTAVTAGLTVRISNEGGAGRLTVRNSSWDCVQASRAAVSCTGGRGSAVLDQAGTGGVVPLVVRVTDARGRTWTQTLRPS